MAAPPPLEATNSPGTKLLGLECLRGLAAFYVFLHHYVRRGLPEFPGLSRYFSFGQVAVMLFFLVSGFVIHYSTSHSGDFNFPRYFLRRIRRLYPPFLIALLITWVGYLLVPIPIAPFSLSGLIGNLLMLQAETGPGNFFSPFLDNYPLWSLGYEFWFYILYGLLMLTPTTFAKKRAIALGLTLFATLLDLWLPNQAARFVSYFPLWWVGVELAEIHRQGFKVSLRKLLPAAAVLLLPLAVRVIELVATSEGAQLTLYGHREITMRRFVTVAVLLALGLAWQRVHFKGFWPLLGVFQYVAPISYALYVTHAPVLRMAVMLAPLKSGLLNFLWICPLVLAVAWVIECPIQSAVNRAFPLKYKSKADATQPEVAG